MAVQQLPGVHAGALQAGFHFALSFRQVQLHSQILLCGVAHQTFPEPVIADVLGVDSGVNFDAAAVEAVPLLRDLHQLPALLVGLEVEVLVLVDVAIAGQGQIGLDAGLRHGLGGGVGVVIQVGNRGNAEAQALGDGKQRRRLCAAGVHFRFLLQQRLKGFGIAQIVGEAPQAGGGQMGVAVDKAGDGHHTGAVHNGPGRFVGGLSLNGDDLPVLDADISAEDDLHPGIHSHGCDIGNEGVQIGTLPFV